MELAPNPRAGLPGTLGAGVVVLIGTIVFGISGNNAYLLSIGSTVAMTSIATIGLGLVIGRAGQLSFGQAGFMALGAYCSAYVTTDWHIPFLLGMLSGAVIAGLVGAGVGFIALRLKGNYLAMATLAAGAIIYGLLSVNSPFGGPNGFTGIPPISIGPIQVISPMDQYVFVCVLLGLVYASCTLLMQTRFGRELAALRDDETGAASVGVNVVARKVQIFTLSAILAGVAGALDAALQTTIAPTLFSPDISLQLFLMVVLGGLGSIPGAVIGTALVLGILQVVPGTGDYALTVMGVAVVVAMAIIPGGIAGFIRWLPALRRIPIKGLRATAHQVATEASPTGPTE